MADKVLKKFIDSQSPICRYNHANRFVWLECFELHGNIRNNVLTDNAKTLMYRFYHVHLLSWFGILASSDFHVTYMSGLNFMKMEIKHFNLIYRYQPL